VVCGLVLGLVAGTLAALPARAWPAGAAAAAPVCAETAPSVTAAVELAVTCVRPVEVLGARTPWETLTAQPSGELTWESSVQARRTEINGGWEPVNTAVAAGPNGLVPAASVLPMSFSPGGDRMPLARLEHQGRALEMSWPEMLPAPQVSGPSVTYPSVLPGVDLVLTVNQDGTGFSEVLVVHGPAAAANPALSRVSFPLAVSPGLQVVHRPGGLAAVDASGVEVFASPTPLMWDSSGRSDQAAGPLVLDAPAAPDRMSGPAEGDRVARMPVGLAAGRVTITPDVGMLTDPGTSWPVYIDPTWDAGEGVTLNAWAMIQSAFGGDDANYKNWSNEGLGHCDVQLDSTCNADNKKRLVYKFNVPTAIHGSVVSSADFAAYQTHAYDCDTLWLNLYGPLGNITASTTWDNYYTQMEGSTNYVTQVMETRKSGCPLGPGWTHLNATAPVRTAATNNWASLQLGLRSPNENSMPNSWKRFNSNATLSITFNRYPNTPGTPSLDPATTAGTGPSGFFSRDATPVLRAAVSDPDGGNVRGLFQIWWGSTKVWEGLSGYVASGGTAQVTVGTALLEGRLYTVRVFGNDGALNSKTWSNFIQFQVDATPPNAVPGVTPRTGQPAVYIEDGWAGGVGVLGKFYFTNNGVTDVASYKYSFNSTSLGSTVGLSGGANGQSLDVSFSPSTVGAQTLRVVSVDRAGWIGPEKLYRFNVDFPGEDGFWRLNEGTGTTAADTSTPGGHPLSLVGTAWTTGPFADFGLDPNDHALLFDSSADVASTSTHVAGTNKSFTVMAFVKLGAAASTYAAVSQDGVYSSGFKLGHVAGDPGCTTVSGACWAFWMLTEDSPTAGATVRAMAPVEVATGEWVHLTGVYDEPADQLRVYACELGTPEAPKAAEPIPGTVASHVSTWNAVGPLRVGRGLYRGAVGDYFPGAVDDVRVFNEIVPIDTIRQICQGAA
jgi:hypothetical protein